MPSSSTDFYLADFGEGRRLDAIGDYFVDRPCPAADGIVRRQPSHWDEAHARFVRQGGSGGEWSFAKPWPVDAVWSVCGIRLQLRPTPFGHLGVFPEQLDNWLWLQQFLPPLPARRVLNLFAYTGGSSLVAAAAGAEVVHVDAARPNVEAAKINAELSELSSAPIRYLTEDARKFVARELRRGNHYDVIILDPPAYGHAAQGKAWRLERDLWPLLEGCIKLLSKDHGALLCTGHSQLGPPEIIQWLHQSVPWDFHSAAGRMKTFDQNKRKLDAGHYVRMTW